MKPIQEQCFGRKLMCMLPYKGYSTAVFGRATVTIRFSTRSDLYQINLLKDLLLVLVYRTKKKSFVKHEYLRNKKLNLIIFRTFSENFYSRPTKENTSFQLLIAYESVYSIRVTALFLFKDVYRCMPVDYI